MFAGVRPARDCIPGAFFGGIAPGLEGTALALLDPVHDAPLAVYMVAARQVTRPGLARYAAFAGMVSGVVRRLERLGTPAMLAVRGYSLRGRSNVHGELIELGAVLRWQLLRRRWQVAEIPPGTMHKFTVGAGSPTPSALAAALAALYRRSFATPREAEAFALAHIARALVYPEGYNPARLEMRAQIARIRALQAQFEQEARTRGQCRAE
jgi:hypothetical protein